MNVSGKILDVRDGDAILLTLRKADQVLLVVIDGGNTSFQQKVVEEVRSLCNRLDKGGPDLVVCTHYDSDHIAGVIALAREFGNRIGELWIHQPPPVLKEGFALVHALLENGNTPLDRLPPKARLLSLEANAKDYPQEFRRLMESVSQLKQLLDLIEERGIPKKEPIAGECTLEGWPEVEVIGPTRSYYEEVFNIEEDFLRFLSAEYELTLAARQKASTALAQNPCDMLKTTSKITPTNKASAIISIQAAGGKLLFTADAGIESLERAAGFPESIANLGFLKVPHHGSINNLSKALIDHMNPAAAYSSGNHHEDPEVIGCLRRDRQREVRTTKEEGDLEFEL